MKIGNIIASTNNYISKVSKRDEKKESDNENISLKYSKKDLNNSITDANQLPYKKIYNKATLENMANATVKSNKELTDKEINNEVDKKLYEQYNLANEGIEFGSNEFEAWKEKYKNNLPIPLEAPAKVRKELSNMIDSIKDPKAKYRICKNLWRGFQNIDASDITSCADVTNKLLNDSKDYLTLLKINNNNSNQFKDVIDYYSEIVDALTKFKVKINDLITEEKK